MNETAVAHQIKSTSVSPSLQGLLQRKCACGTHQLSDGECEECSKKKLALQRFPSSTQREDDSVPSIVYEVLASPGQPLDPQTRAFFEPRFGFDFNKVRVHTDAKAIQSAKAVNALAYTVGNNVVFDSGQYSPKSNSGKQLIAHELTHVLQQSTNGTLHHRDSGGIHINEPNDAYERQADEIASNVTSQPINNIGIRHISPLSFGEKKTIQRQINRSLGTNVTSSRGAAIIEDGQRAAPGQMHRTEFLTTLRDRLIQACDAELAPFGRSARGCPYILRTIEKYAGRPASALLSLIRHFAHPPAGSDANGLINSVVQKSRIVARKVAQKVPDRTGQKVQAMSERGFPNSTAYDPLAVRAQLGSGNPLDIGVQNHMEHSFGTSFKAIRIHTDSKAAYLNSAFSARAFTVGQDIAFGAGEYRPGTSSGDMLIAHELAHTIQQGSGMIASSGNTNDQEMERQADRAASSAIDRRENAAFFLQAGSNELRIQRWPAVVAGALIVAEAAPEAVVIAEVAAVSTEVAVVDTALVVTAAEVAAPTAIEIVAPAAVETLAPAAIETLAPAAVEASSSAFSTAAAATAVGVSATTLSSDSPTQTQEPEQDRRKSCLERNPYALICEDEIDMEEGVQEFIMRQGYGYESLGNCSGFNTHGPGVIGDCNGASGESWHCRVNPYSDPIAGRTLPGGIVSVFSCLCCRTDGTTGFEWRGHHWSPGSS